MPQRAFAAEWVACLVAGKGEARDEPVLRAALRERLAAFKIPKRGLVLEELPRNAMGKVQKAELRRLHAALFQDG